MMDTKSDEYQKYINSAQWKRLRKYAIEQAGGVCQQCGVTKYSRALEVHHLTYERLGKERLSDLKVLCDICHKGKHFKPGPGRNDNGQWVDRDYIMNKINGKWFVNGKPFRVDTSKAR